MNLSFHNERFDAVTAAFGIRNFKDLDKCLCELHRVLRKGGHLSIVELSAPKSFPMSILFKIYSHTILPLYARLVSKDKGAYRYLISTVEAFPQGETMVEILKKAGFEEVKFKRLTFGIWHHVPGNQVANVLSNNKGCDSCVDLDRQFEYPNIQENYG